MILLAGSRSRYAQKCPSSLPGSRDQSFAVLRRNRTFLIIMAAGSVAGTFIGGRLLGIAPDAVLSPALAAVLLISAWKVWRHQ